VGRQAANTSVLWPVAERRHGDFPLFVAAGGGVAQPVRGRDRGARGLLPGSAGVKQARDQRPLAPRGSDLHLHLHGGYIPAMRAGDVLKHEFMAEVAEVGPGVRIPPGGQPGGGRIVHRLRPVPE
jgi:hypothetical protein